MGKRSGTWAGLWLLAVAGAAASADTLVLRNGQRIQGTLVGVRRDRIEFEEQDGGRTRNRSFDRADVRRIEIDDDYPGDSDSRDDREERGSIPSGLRERTVNVSANIAWTDTGIELRRGQDVRFRASGKVRWGPDRSDGPRGEGGNHYNANRPMPNRPGAALIARIHGDVFFVGDEEGPISIRESGRLYLGVNDDFLQDNSGSFRVVVYY